MVYFFRKKVNTMSVNNKIRALLQLQGKKPHELAEAFGISPQAMRNKMSRNSFYAEDLIKIADFLDCELAFILSENQKISLGSEDLRTPIKKDPSDSPGPLAVGLRRGRGSKQGECL
jgi:transcriptional regulator with XRE-family HTH domain